MRTIDLMTPSQLSGLHDAGRGHLADGPTMDRALRQIGVGYEAPPPKPRGSMKAPDGSRALAKPEEL